MTTLNLAMTAAATAVGLVAMSAAYSVRAQDQPHYLSAAVMRERVAKTTDGVAGGPIPTGSGAIVLLAKRTRSGDIEVHTHLSDEIIVEAGHAVIRVGSGVDGAHEVSAGEWRGGTMSGEQRYEMAPGDALWIPAGAPHQVVVPDGGSFTYLAVKFKANTEPRQGN